MSTNEERGLATRLRDRAALVTGAGSGIGSGSRKRSTAMDDRCAAPV